MDRLDIKLAKTSAGADISLRITNNVGATAMSVSNVGSIATIAGATFSLGGRITFQSPSSGQLTISNGSFNDFTRFQLGGTSSSFPALGRSATFLTVHLADGTAGGGVQLSEGASIDFGTTTGSKIGNSTSQKIGFWNATPAIQPTAVADASGGATVDTEARAALNDLLARMRTIGLMAP